MPIMDLSNADAIPVLREAVRFAAQRQRFIAHNVANLTTPNFRPVDVSVPDFQENLSRAIDERRNRTGGSRGELRPRETRELGRDDQNRLELHPREAGRNILFHDRNNRDLERTMQDLVENASAFRMASMMLRSRFSLLETAITERV